MCTFAGVFETVVTAQRELPKQHGEMPEWSNGAVSKTVDLFLGSKGSNPFLSATTQGETSRNAGLPLLFSSYLHLSPVALHP